MNQACYTNGWQAQHTTWKQGGAIRPLGNRSLTSRAVPESTPTCRGWVVAKGGGRRPVPMGKSARGAGGCPF